MGNMIDYVKEYGVYSFAERPFSDVDSLVLSQFAYLKLDGLVPGISEKKEWISLQDVKRKKKDAEIFADERYAEVNRQLFDAMCESRRFGRMGLNFYENRIDKERKSQFCALVCLPEGAEVYVAYRGTDETLIGWREDFNMAFSAPVWGQKLSVEYLERVVKICLEQIPKGVDKDAFRFMAGGHSKGGNLAVYASMNCEAGVQERIKRIYSHDGPGFRPEILESSDYDRIQSRIRKIIPHSSVVGMILENHEAYEVVESNTFGMLQHNPYTWLVEDGRFVEAKDIYQGRKLLDQVINTWILSLDEAHLRCFVEGLFQVLEASEAETLLDFTGEWKKSMNGMIGALKETDEDTKAMTKKVVQSFFQAAAQVAKAHTKQGTALHSRHKSRK